MKLGCFGDLSALEGGVQRGETSPLCPAKRGRIACCVAVPMTQPVARSVSLNHPQHRSQVFRSNRTPI